MAAGSPRVAFASALGCKLDVDFRTGRTATGAPATDNTGTLNAFLATASRAHPVKLILDGPALVRGLVISTEGQTTIEGLGWGTGLYLADGANQDAIRLGPYLGHQTEGQDVSPVPARAATAIALRDFAIYGNGQRSATGPRQGTAPADQPVPGAPVHAVFGVALTNCTGVLLGHLRIIDAPCYAVMIANASDVSVVHCAFESGHIFQDGVHVNGPAERVLVDGCRFRTGDDAVALNAPEGFGGDIEDVHVTNCLNEGSLTMLRVYTSVASIAKTFRVRHVVVTGCTGTTQSEAFNLGIEGNQATSAPDQIEDLLITGCMFTARSFAVLSTSIGLLTLRDCVYRATAPEAAMLAVQTAGANRIALQGVTVLRAPGGVATGPVVSVDGPARVQRLSIAGLAVVDEQGVHPAARCVLSAVGGVESLGLEAIDMGRIANLVDPASGWRAVGAVSGAGLLGSGALVPDDKVADNTLYLSAADGGLAIKRGGTVRRLGA